MNPNIAKVFIVHASDAVKDEALNVCIASGEEDIFIDMDTVGDRMPDNDTPENAELREIVEKANEVDAQYIHMY